MQPVHHDAERPSYVDTSAGNKRDRISKLTAPCGTTVWTLVMFLHGGFSQPITPNIHKDATLFLSHATFLINYTDDTSMIPNTTCF